MASKCEEEVYSEDFLDFLVEYVESTEMIKEMHNAECYEIASNRYAVIYEQGTSYPNNALSGIKAIPHCYGLLSSVQVLETAGITKVQRQPGLNLYGQGVLVGFIDTGIDYSHPAFIGSDGRSKILSIWDQSIQTDNDSTPEEFGFGTEYTNEEINTALQSDNPLEIVPSRDDNGHGTFIAGVAAGNRIEEKEFAGVAPLAKICVVKCKEAKQNLKDYYYIHSAEPCYAEGDIMLGVRYLFLQAVKHKMPLVICIGMGTNLGGHICGSLLGRLLQEYGDYHGIFVTTAGGNEGNASHHYRNISLENEEVVEVEVRVGEKESGFSMEIWTEATNLYSVGLISPDGEYSGKTQARLGERREIRFLFENTVVYIEYLLFSFECGDECIRIRFQNPSSGIWRIRVFNEYRNASRFDIWLPIRNFIEKDTYFLRPDPDTTLCDPSNNEGVITDAYYNSYNRAVAVDASRGYTRNNSIKPDFASPGVDVYGPLKYAGNYPSTEQERNERARYGYKTGSSYSNAITAGTVALLAEWALVKGNDISMDTVTAKKYLIRGADKTGISIPNQTWGNGLLDIYGVFENLRPR